MAPASEAGQALVAQRKRHVFRCVVCGRLTRGIRIKRYCGRTCIQRAYRRRRREQQAAA